MTIKVTTTTVLVALFGLHVVCAVHYRGDYDGGHNRHHYDEHQHWQYRSQRLYASHQQYVPSPPPPPAPYHFGYDVKDSDTHDDVQSRYEESDGHGNVKGSYSLIEPDGSTRVVEYTADHERGFNAVVKKTGVHRGEHVATAIAAAAAAGYRGPEFLQHSSRPSSYYKFYWLPARNHQ